MKKNFVNVPFCVSGIVLFLLVAASITYIPVGAQPTMYTTDPNREPDERIQVFFNDLIQGNTSKAFNELLRTSAGNEALAEIRSKLDEVPSQCGPFRKYEKIDAKPVGKDLLFLRYLLKGEQHPVVWTFTFYRRPSETGAMTTNPQWTLVGLRFDTNLDPLLL